MLSRASLFTVYALLLCLSVRGQEATSGVSVPVTVSGDARATRTTPAQDAGTSSTAAGFRVVVSPTLKFGPHWFAYCAVDVHSRDYFTYPTGNGGSHPVQLELMQAFVGYSVTVSNKSFLIKAGQLSSAFGVFPLEYDDAKMPLINAPPSYTTYLPLRSDQLPCGVYDVLAQNYGSAVAYHCGGAGTERYGMVPLSLFGLPGVEAQVSIARIDARLQITNTSPANPHGLTSSGQVPQWTAGAGYTFRGGLHVGVSGFRGAYLDAGLAPLLPAGKTISSFPAWAVGADAEWSRGRWSVEGEWQHFHFDVPNFSVSPPIDAAYGQAKWILSPRFFLAMLASSQQFGRIQDNSGLSANPLAGPQQVYEFSAGYRLNRQQLLKIGGAWTSRNSWITNDWFWPRADQYTIEAQLVTSFTAVSKAFR